MNLRKSNITGTMINYYVHCQRQCWLFAHRLNMEDQSELVKIGKAIQDTSQTERQIGNFYVDRITQSHIIEVKKSDADPEAARWQLISYLVRAKALGIVRKGRLEYQEKRSKEKKITEIILTDELESEYERLVQKVMELLSEERVPDVIKKPYCKKCAYYEYCFI